MYNRTGTHAVSAEQPCGGAEATHTTPPAEAEDQCTHLVVDAENAQPRAPDTLLGDVHMLESIPGEDHIESTAIDLQRRGVLDQVAHHHRLPDVWYDRRVRRSIRLDHEGLLQNVLAEDWRRAWQIRRSFVRRNVRRYVVLRHATVDVRRRERTRRFIPTADARALFTQAICQN
jgi:hypothetical protein